MQHYFRDPVALHPKVETWDTVLPAKRNTFEGNKKKKETKPLASSYRPAPSNPELTWT